MKNTGSLRIQTHRPRLTAKVDLPGGQDRLRQLILYVARRCETATYFGLTKLNKILWKADFEAFAARQRPITGRSYQRLPLGPALREMVPLLKEMLRDGILQLEIVYYGKDEEGRDVEEKRPKAAAEPKLSYFTEEDMGFVERAIAYYWTKTGRETSDDSHGVAWKARKHKSAMYYELSYLSDDQITDVERADLIRKLRSRRIGRDR